MMEAAHTYETLVNFYQTTRRYNPEDGHLRNHNRENLKSNCLTISRRFQSAHISTPSINCGFKSPHWISLQSWYADNLLWASCYEFRVFHGFWTSPPGLSFLLRSEFVRVLLTTLCFMVKTADSKSLAVLYLGRLCCVLIRRLSVCRAIYVQTYCALHIRT
jgi:hypothetical protein